MLEVCFNDSVKIALTLAQSGSLDGGRKDIAGISFGLSEGNIKSPIVFQDCPRKEYVYSIFSFRRYNNHEDMDDSFDEFWQHSIEDLEKLKANPEKIRIWIDHTPDAQCGLLFVANLLKNSDSEIHIVELPKKIKRDAHCEIEYHGWDEVEPKLFESFLNRERILNYQEIEDLSNRWQILKSENAPLRVVENDMVISADISYYDDLIREVFPKDTCKIANIIGRVLCMQKVLTGDIFIAKRIQNFIDNGELTVMCDTKNGFYSTSVSSLK